MNPMDRWWNRNFPAHSVRRLVFFWVAVLPMSLATAGVIRVVFGDGDLNGGIFWMSFIGSEFMITLAWYLARSREDIFATRPIAEESTEWPSVPSFPTPGDAGRRPPPPRAPQMLFSLPKRRMGRAADLALCVLISVIGFTIAMVLLGLEDPWSAQQLLIDLVAGTLIGFAIVFRSSPLTPILIAVVGGYPFAALLQVFFSFMGGDDSLLFYWAMASLGIFAMMFPFTSPFGRRRDRLRELGIPSYVIALSAMVFLILTASFAGSSQQTPDNAIAAVPPELIPGASAPPASTLGDVSREGAAMRLFEAWRNADRPAASQVASPSAVASLFTRSPDRAAGFRGCGRVFGGYLRCVIETSSELILLEPADTGDGRVYIRRVELKPLDYAVDYDAT